MRLVTLCRANFGTALENFSLAAFRGKLGEFSTWPIVLHYGDDKVHSPRARKIEIYIYIYFRMKCRQTLLGRNKLRDFVHPNSYG